MNGRWILLAAAVLLPTATAGRPEGRPLQVKGRPLQLEGRPLQQREAAEPQTTTRRYTPADRERERYVYVPFEVPPGTTEVRVRYAYDRMQGQNTIDLGVFEPGPLDLGTTALRGYSGGSKSEVSIG